MTKHPNVRKFLDLSTAHISEETANRLDNPEDLSKDLTCYPTGYGWFVYVLPNEADLDIPADLATLFDKARELDCDYLLLDGDATEIDGLPTWEW